MAAKIPSLRIFRAIDGDSSFERSLDDVNGGLLVVSQFTLYGDARKGRRPSFIDAAPPADAERLYDRFVELLRAQASGPVETGRFGAMLEVELVNDGPVTLLLERGAHGSSWHPSPRGAQSCCARCGLPSTSHPLPSTRRMHPTSRPPGTRSGSRARRRLRSRAGDRMHSLWAVTPWSWWTAPCSASRATRMTPSRC